MANVTTVLLKKYPKLDFLMTCLLSEVEKNEGHCLSSYAERLAQDENTVLYCVKRLSKEYRNRSGFNLLKIEHCKKDKRRRLLFLTKSGKDLVRLTKPLFDVEEVPERDKNTIDMFEK